MNKQTTLGRKIVRKYRLRPDLDLKLEIHARKWHLTRTSIVEHGLDEFFKKARQGLRPVARKACAA